MKGSKESHNRAVMKWEKKTLDRFLVRTRKDGDLTKERIQAAATAAGESLNGYVLEAIRQRIERDDA